MSPLPSPTPLRRTFAKIVFSPSGLLFAFVVLVIVACPGARAADGVRSSAASTDPLFMLAKQGMNPDADVFVPPVRPRMTTPIGRSGRLDAVAPTKARSATPAERGEPAAKVSSVTLRPMIGPPVGIRSRLPQERL